MTDPKRLDFYLDFVSPFAYLANARLPEIARWHGLALRYLPVDVANAKRAAGNEAPSTRSLPAKAKFIRRDRLQWAARYGLPMTDPPAFRAPRLNAGLLYAADHGCEAAYAQSAFHQVWGCGQDPDADQTISRVAAEAGLDPAALLAYVRSSHARDRYQAGEREAWNRGVFGVPMVITADDQMFWGNDRLDFLEQHLQEAGAKLE